MILVYNVYILIIFDDGCLVLRGFCKYIDEYLYFQFDVSFFVYNFFNCKFRKFFKQLSEKKY